MPISHVSLDSTVREHMLRELDSDIASGNVYLSPRLNETGAAAWPELLREAIAEHDDAWLAEEIGQGGLLREMEQKRKPRSEELMLARVPSNAADMLAEGEFNRLYARGLCSCVIEEGGNEVEVCRGRESSRPRPESEAKIGDRYAADALLADLRTSQGLEPALGIPMVNSGLTVKRPGKDEA